MALNLGPIDNPDPENTVSLNQIREAERDLVHPLQEPENPRNALQLGPLLGKGDPRPPGHLADTGPSAAEILDSEDFLADQKRRAAEDHEHLLDISRRPDATHIKGAREMYALSTERAQQRLNGIAREEEQLNLQREVAERENAREKREQERELREEERELRERERVKSEQARDLRDQNRETQEKQYNRRSMQVMVATLGFAALTLIVTVAGIFL